MTKVDESPDPAGTSSFPKGLPPSQEEEFYLAWGRETFKTNISRLNDLQKNLTTISISLLGGSLIFYNDTFIEPIFKKIALVVLLVAAVINVLGSFPEDEKVDLAVPEAIKKFKEKTFRRKRCWYFASFVSILIGLGFALLGVLVKQ